jgi:hypothetical protein
MMEVVRTLAISVLAFGCGRIGFDVLTGPTGGGDGGGTNDGRSRDASTSFALIQSQSIAPQLVTDAVLSFVAPPQPGNMVWVGLATYGAPITGVSDTYGNTYTQAFGVEGAGMAGVWGFYATNVQSGAARFTVTAAGLSIGAIHLREYSGVGALVTTVNGMGTGALADAGGIAVPAQGGLLVAAQTHSMNLTTLVGSGWADYVDITEDNNSCQAMSVEDLLDPPQGTYHGTFTYMPPDTVGWLAAVAEFSH